MSRILYKNYNDESEDWYYIADLNEFRQAVNLYGCNVYRVHKFGDRKVTELNKMVKTFIEEEEEKDEEIDICYDLEFLELIEKINLRFSIRLETEICSNYENFEEGEIVWDDDEKKFIYTSDFFFDTIISYWGGNDWITESVDCLSDEEIPDDLGYVCLDEWENSNFTSGAVGFHSYVARLDDDKYLINETSQWVGSRERAAIVGREKLIEYLDNLGRDIEEYLKIVDKKFAITK